MKKHIETKIYHLMMNGNLWDDAPDLLFEVSHDDREFDYFSLCKGKSVSKNWPSDFVINVTGKTLVDFFYCGAYYTVISDKAKEIFEQFSQSVEFLPIHLKHEDTQKIMPNYWVLNILEVLEVLDWENTYWIEKIIPYNEPDAYSRIIKPALIGKLINKDVFHINVGGKVTRTVFVSNNLRRMLINVNTRMGMSFGPVKVT